MEAVVTDFTDNSVEIRVKEEDVSILYILQHELLKNKKIEFAGVALKHPLIREYSMRVVTDSGNPFDAIVESAETAREYVDSLAELIKKVK
jgi:DNA-directed RNA polymerase subunit L